MLKFFRRIRKRLVTDGQVGKYILYASGEILLVVIGILIALQINNRNEFLKNKVFEQEMLAQISINLDEDEQNLTRIYKNFQMAIGSAEKVINHSFVLDSPDSLQYWLADVIRFDRFQPLHNAYEVLKSKGLDLVSNKDLRFLMGTYYDDRANHVQKSIEDIEKSFVMDWMPLLRSDVDEMQFGDYISVNDYGIFEKGNPARNLIVLTRDNYNSGMNRIAEVIDEIQELNNLIHRELDN